MKVVMISGGSSGIGLECAKRFSGDLVSISGRNEKRLADAKKVLLDAGVNVKTQVCDISDPVSVAAWFEAAAQDGQISAVINSAGVSSDTSSKDLILKIDLIGANYILEESLKHAVEGGSVILISSMMGYLVPPNPAYDHFLANPLEDGALQALDGIIPDAPSAYNFTKRGIHLLVERYAKKFGEKKIRLNSISPGIILTPMGEDAVAKHADQMKWMKLITPAGRFGIPEDIADAVSFLTSDKAAFITGTDLRVDGGLIPSLREAMAAKQ